MAGAGLFTLLCEVHRWQCWGWEQDQEPSAVLKQLQSRHVACLGLPEKSRVTHKRFRLVTDGQVVTLGPQALAPAWCPHEDLPGVEGTGRGDMSGGEEASKLVCDSQLKVNQ